MEPPSIVTIRAKRRGRGHGGWSKNNPYMEDEDSRFVDFDIDICPASLVQRIVSVRDQIAGEWTADLETLRVANAMILDSYHTFQSKQRQTEAEARQKKKQQQEATDTKSDDDGDWSEDAKASATASNEANNQLTAPYSSAYDKTFKAYDRTAMMVLGNNIVHDGRSSSAYRTGSFDLLGLLATQESIHRVLRNYRRDSSRGESSSWQWLYQFYVARIPTYFDGNQEYGRADDFLEELLLTPPSVVFASSKTSASTTSGVNFIDPMRMAEDIIAMRSQVVLDWKEIVSRVTVQDHVDLVKMSLAIRMGHTLERSPSMQSLQQQTVGDDSGFQ